MPDISVYSMRMYYPARRQQGVSGASDTMNPSISQGDRVFTGHGAHAELQLDYANILRICRTTFPQM